MSSGGLAVPRQAEKPSTSARVESASPRSSSVIDVLEACGCTSDRSHLGQPVVLFRLHAEEFPVNQIVVLPESRGGPPDLARVVVQIRNDALHPNGTELRVVDPDDAFPLVK